MNKMIDNKMIDIEQPDFEDMALAMISPVIHLIIGPVNVWLLTIEKTLQEVWDEAVRQGKAKGADDAHKQMAADNAEMKTINDPEGND